MNQRALIKLLKKAKARQPAQLTPVEPKLSMGQNRFIATNLIRRMARPIREPFSFPIVQANPYNAPVPPKQTEKIVEKIVEVPLKGYVKKTDLQDMLLEMEVNLILKFQQMINDALKKVPAQKKGNLPEIEINAKAGNVSRLRFLLNGIDIGQDIQTIDFVSGFTIDRKAPGYLGLTALGGTASTAPEFVDNETPSGTIDGVNTTFTLGSTPLPNSVRLFLNGMFLTQGVDYTLSGSTITFVTAPDALFSGLPFKAFYRTDDGDAGFADNETPSGTINGVNTVFTLAGTPNAANSLTLYQNGQFLTQGVDYTLSGLTITFVTAPDALLTGLPFKAFYRTSDGSTLFADNETPSGLINGSNTAYNLVHNPDPTSGGVMLYQNGMYLTQGVDFNLSGNIITFVAAPDALLSGLPFKAFYRY